MRQWFEPEVIRQRTTLSDEIIGILTSSIERLRAEPRLPQTGSVREEIDDYGQ